MERLGDAGYIHVIGWNLVAMSQEDKKQAEKQCRERAMERTYF